MDVQLYSGRPLTAHYVHGYGIGYYFGRAHGDEDLGREDMVRRFGVSDVTNLDVYEGFRVGYSDGVNDYADEVD